MPPCFSRARAHPNAAGIAATANSPILPCGAASIQPRCLAHKSGPSALNSKAVAHTRQLLTLLQISPLACTG
ncbi:hypothetical protein M0R45_020648 [Rubus argutus]|uniref:Uncharacterized protein n=1 Tax=Rubus argutus TaxID=59490 RepID=A0AAW1XCH1_RUBAR